MLIYDFQFRPGERPLFPEFQPTLEEIDEAQWRAASGRTLRDDLNDLARLVDGVDEEEERRILRNTRDGEVIDLLLNPARSSA